MIARKLSADSVCAYVWAHTCEQTRGALCACASLPDSLALLEWFELGNDNRAALRHEIAEIIDANASRQRAEWAVERAA